MIRLLLFAVIVLNPLFVVAIEIAVACHHAKPISFALAVIVSHAPAFFLFLIPSRRDSL